MGGVSRVGAGPNVDHVVYLVALEQVEELLERLVGVTDGPDCEVLIVSRVAHRRCSLVIQRCRGEYSIARQDRPAALASATVRIALGSAAGVRCRRAIGDARGAIGRELRRGVSGNGNA